MQLHLLPYRLAVCRLAPDAPYPAWARGPLVSVTRTEDEVSVVCNAESVPSGVNREGAWRALKVAGPLAFSEIGILAGLVTPLAEAEVSVFALSTFDTDYLLVKQAALSQTITALERAGHRVEDKA